MGAYLLYRDLMYAQLGVRTSLCYLVRPRPQEQGSEIVWKPPSEWQVVLKPQ